MRLPCAVALGLLLAACPRPPGPDAGAPDAAVDSGEPDSGFDAGHPRPDAGAPDAGFTRAVIENWCANRTLVQCQRDVRCLRITAADLPSCLARRGESCDQTAYTRAVREGRLQYLESEAIKCLNAHAFGSCADAPSTCADVFAGLVYPDAGCVLAEECDPGSGFCYQYDNVCPHHCRGWTPLGERCDGFTTQCDPISACELGDGGANVCQPAKAEGATCVNYDGCGKGFVCTNGACVRQSAAPLERCGGTNGYPYCSGEYFCRQSLATTPPPPGTCQRKAGLAGACSGNSDCLPSLRCSTVLTTGVCVEKASAGAGCASYDDCRDGLFCSGRDQRCEALPTDGGDCSSLGSFYQCATGYFCSFDSTGNDDHCLPRGALGAPCTYAGQCLSNDCEYGYLPDGGYAGSCIEPCSVRADGGF